MFELLNMYILLHIFLIALSLYTLFKLGKDIVTVLEARFFRFIIVMFVLYVITAATWTLFEYGKIDLPGWAFVLNSSLSYMFLAFIAFGLYIFVMFRHGFTIKYPRLIWITSTIPILIVGISLIVSCFTGIVFSFEDGGEMVKNIVNGPLYALMLVPIMLYFVVIAVISIVSALKTKSPLKRREYIWLTIAMALIIVSVLGLGVLFMHLTILPMAIFAVIYITFTNLQESGINKDALTGLNNRRRANDYFKEKLSNVSDQQPVVLFVSDVNFFKTINDEYGHIEGDRALILTAGVIRQTVGKYNGFIARYGGDEFVFSVMPHPERDDDFTPDGVIAEIDERLSECCKKENKPYTVTVSTGYVVCDDPKIPFGVYFIKADEMLYEIKRKYHESMKANK